MDLHHRALKFNWVIWGLLLLLLIRLGEQGLLYHSGFTALTADDFGRTIAAANWARHPAIIWQGLWLPYHYYLIGSALRLVWELTMVPRMLTILLGAVSIVLMYRLAFQLYERRIVGLVAALLLTVNPAHLWLSSAPLTEIPYTVCILGCLLTFVGYLKTERFRYLFLSAVCLLLANGFRFEGWMVSIVFSIYLVVLAILAYLHKQATLRHTGLLLIAAVIPWLLPVSWILGEYAATRSWWALITVQSVYKTVWYGANSDIGYYWKTFLQIDPFAFILALPALGICIFQTKRKQPVFGYATLCLAPFVIFMLLHRGQSEPQGNYLRYLAPFLFVLYPAVAFLIYFLVKKILHNQRWFSVFMGILVILIAVYQTSAAFAYSTDPAGYGLAVGRHIRELRQGNLTLQNAPVLIELSYWQYLAIHVGANDITSILYDRPLDIGSRNEQSLIQEDLTAVRRCIAQDKIGLIVVKTPELKQILENDLTLSPGEVINGYTFYIIPERLYELEGQGTEPCPLSYGSGY